MKQQNLLMALARQEKLRWQLRAFSRSDCTANSKQRELAASAARRLIKQGGAYINGRRIEDQDYLVTTADFNDHELLLRAGKKKYHRIRIKN